MRYVFRMTLTILVFGSALGTAVGQPWTVDQFGAKGDGVSDDTRAFQLALDAAAEAGGGVVLAPRGVYRLEGRLNVPGAVMLKGIWESVPAHNGLRNRDLPKPTDDGTTFYWTGSLERPCS